MIQFPGRRCTFESWFTPLLEMPDDMELFFELTARSKSTCAPDNLAIHFSIFSILLRKCNPAYPILNISINVKYGWFILEATLA